MCWWCSWWSARGCQGFHKEAWWEWDQVHKTWQMHCWLFLRKNHQWPTQKLARVSSERGIRASSWVWRRKIVSDGADFLSEVIRKDIQKVVRVKCWSKRWRSAFAEDGVEVLKELFTGCARLNLSRVVGLFGFIYKVCYYLFNGVVYLFVDGELRFEPSSLSPAERGKEGTEYPGGARSAILASSPAGRSQVSVSSMTVDVKLYWTMLRHWSQFVPNMSTDIYGH